METQFIESLRVANGDGRSRQWVRSVLTLLDTAATQLRPEEQGVHVAILEATSVLRKQVEPEVAQAPSDGRGRLLAWQTRRVCDFVETRISGPIRVSHLCALIRLSEAHFSRAFKRTFGESPHAFVIRRRVEMAARCMLNTDASLSDIAQRFGFTDQAHLCKQFRQAMGQTPAAWRRMQRSFGDLSATAQAERAAA